MSTIKKGADRGLPKDLQKQTDAALSNGMIKLFVLHMLKKGSAFALNANVLVISSGGESLDSLAKENLLQLRRIASGQVTLKKVSLPAGNAELIEYHRLVQTATGPLDVDFVSYLLIKNGNQFILTFSTPPDEKSLKPQMVEMAKSLRIG
jgi:hypothetical protein